LIITKNAEAMLDKVLKSVRGLVNEVIIIDDYSTDKTLSIAEKHKAKIFLHHQKDYGRQKGYGLKKCQGDWILVLDSDEILSPGLKKEIKLLFKTKKISQYSAFFIPFQNHFLGRKINYGGESYKKLRFFKKNAVKIDPSLVHEKFEVIQGKVGQLKNKVYHYSYRSYIQVLKKFTDYAIREARKKYQKKEKLTLKKLFLYAPHMFYARFIKDKGYKDGLFRIPLDLAFSYMEGLTYWYLLYLNFKKILKSKSFYFGCFF